MRGLLPKKGLIAPIIPKKEKKEKRRGEFPGNPYSEASLFSRGRGGLLLPWIH